MADKLKTVFGDPDEPAQSAVEARVPPHDLDAEAACLSAMMNDKLALDKVAEILAAEQFYSEAHRRMCEACYAISAAGTQPDIVTVATWLRERDRLAQVGGMEYITRVLNAAPALANVVAYATAVLECWKARQLILITQRYQAAGYAGYGEYGSATGMVNACAADIFALESSGDKSKVEHIGAILGDVFEKVQRANARGRNITGLSTGYDTYDRITSGLHGGELTVVAARPGMGKTALVTGMLMNVTAPPVEGWPEYDPANDETWLPGVVLFSLEMPKEQIVQRMMCSHGRVEMAKLRTNQVTGVDWEKLTRAAGELHARFFYIDDQPALTTMEMRAKLRRKIAEAKTPSDSAKRKVKIVAAAVDYFQLMKGNPDAQNREQEVAGISRDCKVMAKELAIPIIGLAQLNRAVETRGGDRGKRPQLSDLRESGALEQDADNIVFIYREDYYNKETADRNVAELIVAKQRNGPTDTVRLRWDGMFTRFDNLAEGEYEGFDA